jgi:hypothetical protein
MFHMRNFMWRRSINAEKEKGFTSEDVNPCSIWCGWQESNPRPLGS